MTLEAKLLYMRTFEISVRFVVVLLRRIVAPECKHHLTRPGITIRSQKIRQNYSKTDFLLLQRE